MADDKFPVVSSSDASTLSTLARPAAEVVVGVTEKGRALVPAEVRVELRQGTTTLTTTNVKAGADGTKLAPGSVAARFERVVPGTYTAHANRVDGGGKVITTADPETVKAVVRHAEVDLFLKGKLVVMVIEDPSTTATPKPIPKAKVNISGPQAASGTTDEKGVVTLQPLASGHYTVKGKHPGYVDGSTTGDVPEPGMAVVQLKRIEIEIVFIGQNGDELLRATETSIVGQRIPLRVKSKPSDHTLSDIQWVIDGKRVSGYEVLMESGVVKKLTDLQSDTVTFHWIAGGDGLNVTVTAKVEGEARRASVKFDVKAPEVVEMTSKTLSTFEVGAPTDPTIQHANVSMDYLKRMPKTGGIIWTFRAMTPTNGQGVFGGFQMINRTLTKTLKKGVLPPERRRGQWVADERVPYQPEHKIRATVDATAMSSDPPWISGDSPGTTLPADAVKVHMKDEFKTHFMYKHKDEDSIWVALGVLEWHCEATVTRTGHGDTPAAWGQPTDVKVSNNPHGQPDDTLPEWDGNIADDNEKNDQER